MKKVRLAIFIMTACILGSSSISAVTSMNRLADVCVEHFFKGQGDNLCLYEDIIDKTEFAADLVNMASKYYGLEKDSSVKEITDVIKKVASEKSVKKLYGYNKTLDNAFSDLAAKVQAAINVKLQDKNLTSQEIENIKQQQSILKDKLLSGYQSELMTMSTDPYNSMVREYYAETKGLLGSFFRLFAKKVEYFE